MAYTIILIPKTDNPTRLFHATRLFGTAEYVQFFYPISSSAKGGIETKLTIYLVKLNTTVIL